MLTVRFLPPRDLAALLVPLDLRDLKVKLDRKDYKDLLALKAREENKVSLESQDLVVLMDVQEPLEETVETEWMEHREHREHPVLEDHRVNVENKVREG